MAVQKPLATQTTDIINSMIEDLQVAQVIVKHDMTKEQQEKVMSMIQNSLSYIYAHGNLI